MRRIARGLAPIAVDLLEAVLKFAGRRVHTYTAERLYRRMFQPFTVRGIRFYPDPCSVGLTDHGEVTGVSAAEMIRTRDLHDLAILDLCCGTGIVGLTVLNLLRDERRVRRLTFVDINIFNIASVRKTISRTPPQALGHVPTDTHVSDGLRALPSDARYDLIVSNPPHYASPSFTGMTLTPDVLGTWDADWHLHKDLFAMAIDHLTERGEIWLLENHRTSPEADLDRLARGAKGVDLIDVFDDPRDPTVFWMILRRAAAVSVSSTTGGALRPEPHPISRQ